METNIWETTAQKLLMTMRVLFVATLTWEFFLTIVFKSSMRAHVLMGITAPFTPFIIILWLIAIIGLTALVTEGVYRGNYEKSSIKRKYTAYTLVGLSALLYVSLTIMAIMNPLVVWPVALNFAVNAGWSVAMFKFRNTFQKIYDKADMA